MEAEGRRVRINTLSGRHFLITKRSDAVTPPGSCDGGNTGVKDSTIQMKLLVTTPNLYRNARTLD